MGKAATRWAVADAPNARGAISTHRASNSGGEALQVLLKTLLRAVARAVGEACTGAREAPWLREKCSTLRSFSQLPVTAIEVTLFPRSILRLATHPDR